MRKIILLYTGILGFWPGPWRDRNMVYNIITRWYRCVGILYDDMVETYSENRCDIVVTINNNVTSRVMFIPKRRCRGAIHFRFLTKRIFILSLVLMRHIFIIVVYWMRKMLFLSRPLSNFNDSRHLKSYLTSVPPTETRCVYALRGSPFCKYKYLIFNRQLNFEKSPKIYRDRSNATNENVLFYLYLQYIYLRYSNTRRYNNYWFFELLRSFHIIGTLRTQRKTNIQGV